MNAELSRLRAMLKNRYGVDTDEKTTLAEAYDLLRHHAAKAEVSKVVPSLR